MDYINQMPEPSYQFIEIPTFMMKHQRFNRTMPKIDLRYLQLLVNWAEQEYTDMKTYYKETDNIRMSMMLSQLDTRKACIRIVAKSSIFGSIVAWMSDKKNWDNLPVHFQRFLHEAYVVYTKS